MGKVSTMMAFGSIILLCFSFVLTPIVYLNFNETSSAFIFNIYLAYLLVLSLGLIVFFVREQNSRTKFKRVCDIGIKVFLLFSCLGLLNFIAKKKFQRWDFSHNKVYSLSTHSKKLLSQASGTQLTFIGTQKERSKYEPLIRLYAEESPGVDLDYLNPEVEVSAVRAKGISRVPALLLERKKRIQRIYAPFTESSISNAFLKISRDQDFQICFHSDSNEYSFLKSLLKEHAFDVLDFELGSKAACDLYFLVFEEDIEQENIRSWEDIIGNEKTVVLLGSDIDQQYPKVILKKLFKNRGVNIFNDVVLDSKLSSKIGDSSIFVFPKSDFTSFQASTDVVYAFTRSFEVAKGMNQTLLSSSEFPKSWSEVNLNQISTQKVVFDKENDLPGPRKVAVRIENMSVFGSTDFLKNKAKVYLGNYDLVMNEIENHLGLKKNYLNKMRKQSPIVLSEDILQNFFYLLVFFFPISFLLIAFSLSFASKE